MLGGSSMPCACALTLTCIFTCFIRSVSGVRSEIMADVASIIRLHRRER